MNVATYKNLLVEVEKGNNCVMITMLNNKNYENKPSRNKTFYTEENLSNQNHISDLDKLLYEKSKYALETGNLQFVKTSENETYLIEPYFPEPRLIILGGGHIAKPLAEFASKTGFSVTVVDDRPSFANSERFPTAQKVICESFDNCFDLINLNKSAYVVIVTRGHRHDMDCLRQVLKHNTAYVGMIGSKRRVKIVMQQMLDDGYSNDKLNKVNAPIGLKIGAVTPDEIAISIISQVISYRRLGDTTAITNPIKTNWPEFDHDVLNELCQEANSPGAMITIISTKGSVPRNAGAKMLVWPFGKILGSIGGGCSEGEIIKTARDLINDGGYKLQSIDMTGTIAEDEGMVCGGIMDVIIETF
ncbi:XdhC family protein [Clostridium estertheticum]|uniref:XdhC family protein n=1 Tax=Clostridium estertheticum TaxID=238834 RepID=UPI001C7DCC9A|nr:XdhC/CoxI family protein [Clostridium estertheticum]MBX4267676.1 XdhC family protein [Clostridium estertheticum]WLC77928.1 XdhC family protein [Clostridium estertheticum]